MLLIRSAGKQRRKGHKPILLLDMSQRQLAAWFQDSLKAILNTLKTK